MNVSVVLRCGRRLVAILPLVGLLALPLSAQQSNTIIGTVLDESTLLPLSNATVTLVESRLQTRTDRNGNFGLADVPPGRFTMRVVAEGYSGAVDEVVVTADQADFVQVMLMPIALLLDEVLVRAGARSGPNNVVAPVDLAALTAADLLQQKVPGVSTGRSGSIGAGTQVTIRGVKSFQLSTQPVIYLDGVRIADSGTDVALGGPKMALLDEIPATDVKRIRILKGPSADAMFGDSANGVILIETVQGSQVR